MQLQHANLPETAQQIADVIGVEKTLELMRNKKRQHSREVYVPKRLRENHWLLKSIGHEAATQRYRVVRDKKRHALGRPVVSKYFKRASEIVFISTLVNVTGFSV